MVFAVIIHYKNINSAPVRGFDKNQVCSEVPVLILENILGGAFNPRYMSVDEPFEEEPTVGNKREVSLAEDFYVDDTFLEQVDEEPAWVVNNHVTLVKKKYGLHRSKRGVDYMQEWHCKTKIEWTDLGPDYFPRFLRSARCLSEKCWFGFYKCKPRSFTVKLLRRKRHFCASIDEGESKVGFAGLQNELRELWVWEERAVNFCCDCTRS
ncbi:Noggin domain containing protein [Asbolus verrucosus]|uniref:Noggin domain containing protein n=1 Tax=Asbolus verrucosus TaxID=1661398 RepID=A0A482VGL5_ASBVE|nr:Noggin domain containing protein [Asbolus verrucosus]